MKKRATTTTTVAAVAIAVACLAVPATATAGIIAWYDFVGSQSGFRPSLDTEPNSTAGNITRPSGPGDFSGTNYTYVSNGSQLNNNGGLGAVIEVMHFTVTPEPGYWLDLDSLDISYGGDVGTGTPTFTYALAVDGVQVWSDAVKWTTGGGTVVWKKSASIPLNVPQFQGRTEPVTFSIRFMTDSTATNNRLRILTTKSTLGPGGTDLVLHGSVIPEPATLSLLGLGMLAVIRRRR